jgi:hypothetical protein
LSSQLRLRSQIPLLPPDFSNKILYSFFIRHTCYMSCPSHAPSVYIVKSTTTAVLTIALLYCRPNIRQF